MRILIIFPHLKFQWYSIANFWHFFAAGRDTVDTIRGRLAPRTLMRIQDFIESHLHEHIDLATLAGLANVSRFHFTRLFRASTGVSAMAYLEQCRMARAQALIRAGELQLASIAFLVGYEDPSYFTRRFRHCCGQTPSAWARTH
jgi:AraC family transcriptional regulator